MGLGFAKAAPNSLYFALTALCCFGVAIALNPFAQRRLKFLGRPIYVVGVVVVLLCAAFASLYGWDIESSAKEMRDAEAAEARQVAAEQARIDASLRPLVMQALPMDE